MLSASSVPSIPHLSPYHPQFKMANTGMRNREKRLRSELDQSRSELENRHREAQMEVAVIREELDRINSQLAYYGGADRLMALYVQEQTITQDLQAEIERLKEELRRRA